MAILCHRPKKDFRQNAKESNLNILGELAYRKPNTISTITKRATEAEDRGPAIELIGDSLAVVCRKRDRSSLLADKREFQVAPKGQDVYAGKARFRDEPGRRFQSSSRSKQDALESGQSRLAPKAKKGLSPTTKTRRARLV